MSKSELTARNQIIDLLSEILQAIKAIKPIISIGRNTPPGWERHRGGQAVKTTAKHNATKGA